MKTNYFTKAGLAIGFFLTSFNALANEGQVSDVDVKITNQTSNDCQLISKEIIHGIFVVPPSASISSNQSNDFVMHTTIEAYGLLSLILTPDADYPADIKFTYQCKDLAHDTSQMTVKFEIQEYGACNSPSLDSFYYAAPITDALPPRFKVLENDRLIAEISYSRACYLGAIYNSDNDKSAMININKRSIS